MRLFDGDDVDTFIKAVEANTTHGLPLSLADREAAASRIIAARPQPSDRAIAASTGLATGAVRTIRQRSTAAGSQPDARIGLDGRVRPLSSAHGRRLASELMKSWPNAPLREIARSSGISLGTARDVRERTRRGEDPVPPKQREIERDNTAGTVQNGHRTPPVRRVAARDRALVLRNLRNDPALRFTESGRSLLRWLDGHTIEQDDWSELLGSIPPHCREVVAELVKWTAQPWQVLAAELEQRVCGAASPNAPGVPLRPMERSI